MALGAPYLALEYIGTVAYAVSGAAVAIRARMDWLGVAVLAVRHTCTPAGLLTPKPSSLSPMPPGWLSSPLPAP